MEGADTAAVRFENRPIAKRQGEAKANVPILTSGQHRIGKWRGQLVYFGSGKQIDLEGMCLKLRCERLPDRRFITGKAVRIHVRPSERDKKMRDLRA